MFKINKNQHNFDINIVVVDNNSHDNTVNLVESHEGVAIIRNSENFGYAKAVNQSIRNLEEEFVL